MSLTHSPSESMLCHCLSTLILIRIMWFYKVAVRSRDEATNLGSCLMRRCIVTTYPKADPWLAVLLNAPESWGNVSFLNSLFSNDDFAYTGTHTHTHAEGAWEQNVKSSAETASKIRHMEQFLYERKFKHPKMLCLSSRDKKDHVIFFHVILFLLLLWNMITP